MEQARIKWQRVLDEPFITPRKDSCAPDAVTTPDIVAFNQGYHLYTGAVSGSQERIIRLPIQPEDITSHQQLILPSETEIVLKPGPKLFDYRHVFDPAAVIWDSRLFLYYSAIGKDQDQIGLAISSDGTNFVKLPAPVLAGRSPEVILKGDMFYLFFVRDLPGQGYAVFLGQSRDGIHFHEVGNEPVLSPGDQENWDDFEVTTPRIIQIENSYYMVYAGLNRGDRKDIPRAFGLARSVDLLHWDKYPDNPVFTCAKSGCWDDGAIWFGTPVQFNDRLYLLYEGGRLDNIIDQSPALTQVGLAALPVEDFFTGVRYWENK